MLQGVRWVIEMNLVKVVCRRMHKQYPTSQPVTSHHLFDAVPVQTTAVHKSCRAHEWVVGSRELREVHKSQVMCVFASVFTAFITKGNSSFHEWHHVFKA